MKKEQSYCVMGTSVRTGKRVEMANLIKSLSKEQLLNRKKYVEIALNFWTENKEQAPKDRVDYNLYYFKKEMNLINKRLYKKEYGRGGYC